MSLELPDIPTELTAASIAAKIAEDNHAKAMVLRDACLAKIKGQVFPCEVDATNYTYVVVCAVVKSLIKGGYKAQRFTKNFELDYGQGMEKRVYIRIDNPDIDDGGEFDY